MSWRLLNSSTWMAVAMIAIATTARSEAMADPALEREFHATVRPFLDTYCIACHGPDEKKADLKLTYGSMADLLKDGSRLGDVLDLLDSEEMPPVKAKRHPSALERSAAVNWFEAVLADETKRHAGDPGVVLARRLSNAEYDYTIRDLTGRDLRPTREFPVDPSNIAGFDNSGESLVMSPALLTKYLKVTREVANHLYLKPDGFAFAPHPMLVETDRDKFCVQQIIDLYHRQNTDYADYFQTAWRFKHRAALGQKNTSLDEIAAQNQVSAKYLATIWSVLEGHREKVGPLAKLQSMWRKLPTPARNQSGATRTGCEEMRTYVTSVRKKVEPRFLNLTAGKIGAARQPMLIWKNTQYATHRRQFDPAQLQVADEPALAAKPAVVEAETSNPFGPGATVLVKNSPGDPDLAVPKGQRARYEAAFARFCSVFPDMFYKQERGRNYFDSTQDRGRYLSAGFHNVMGYFRDDQPLYELVLDTTQQKELDDRWREMDFVAEANIRTYVQFSSSREARGNLGAGAEEKAGDYARSEDKELASEPKLRQLETTYLSLAQGASDTGIKAIKDYFNGMNDSIRWVEKAQVDAEPVHLAALLDFTARAYRHPLTTEEKDEILTFYRSCREKDGLDHETAIRESVISVLMSPDVSYRIDLVERSDGIHPLSDYDLASRLSYFLWSSIPDTELLAHAAAGDLHEPKVIAAQARRMVKDPRIRALAVEFGGNWLDFRRFEELGTVDRERFPFFTSELRTAMFEEPVRLLMDVFQNDRPVLDLVYGTDTFVNPVLARHYGLPITGSSDQWVRFEHADRYGRGGLLPMAVFLTKNAPGLRTSPVKRGNWVVKNVLGERIPAPPPVVPELPRDEAKLELPLREMLARHRDNPNCAACHARFDAMGLVFEGFGPVGERREKDLGGRLVDTRATFPGGGEGEGVTGLQKYIQARRQNDFVANLSSKLLVYALGRSVLLSDKPLIKEMQSDLSVHDYHFGNLIEKIVTSRQFLTKQGGDSLALTESQP